MIRSADCFRFVWRLWLLSLLLLASGTKSLAKGQPAWLSETLKQPVTSQPVTVPALVLFNEQQIVVEDSQSWTETTRYALRLLASNSQNLAGFSLNYTAGTDEVTHLSAFLVKADGTVNDFGKSDWIDHTLLDDTTLYSDFRSKTINVSAYAKPGDIFGCEVTVRRRKNHGETVWMPFSDLPVRLMKLSVKVPRDWEVKPHWIGQPADPLPEDPARKGFQEWCWRDQPYRPEESHAPATPEVYVFLKFQPQPGTKVKASDSMATWSDVANRAAQYQDGSCDATAKLAGMAKKLSDGQGTRQKQIEAFCRFVQQCPYASVNKNIGLGFGFRPRLASKVLETQYGDCKDKVNLLRALLREIGVTVFPLVVSAQTPSEIDTTWPSLLQFNHMIAAIQLSEPSTLPSATEIPGLGPCLIFDPTSEQTPFGYLPWALQDSEALLCAPRSAGLIRLPRLAEELRWRQTGHSELELAGSGLSGRTTLEIAGELAGGFRHAARQLKETELREKWSATFNRKARGVTVTDFSYDDNWSEDRVTLKAGFKAPDFGQKMANQLWLIRLNLFSQISIPTLTEHGRRRPYVVVPIFDFEKLELRWPAEYTPENVPGDVDLYGEFGTYRATYRVQDGGIHVDRAFSLKGGILNPAQYAEFRKFLLGVAKADQGTLVLRKPD